jgi:clorobiocin biosynthesis protein Clo-hal
MLDCSGQDSLLSRKFGLRSYDERMNNYALWGYWRGGKWNAEYLGHPDLARIFIATTRRGWIWYIPVRRDTISVGFVTHRQTLRTNRSNPNQLYFDELTACPEIRDLLEGAELVRLSTDQRRDICVIRDWSYDSRRIAGPGWALVGDAAGFVDPILSSGVMLAHELGQKAAYTINSSFEAQNDGQIAKYWEFYESTYRTYLQAYRDMAAFWYSNNFSMESWWWQARRGIAQSEGSLHLSDIEAFTRLASGYANRAESVSLFGSYTQEEAHKVADGLFGVSDQWHHLTDEVAERPLHLQRQARLTDGFCYHSGFVHPAWRILNEGNGRYLDLYPGEELLVEALKRECTVKDLDRVVNGLQSLNIWSGLRTSTELVIQLNDIGALS